MNTSEHLLACLAEEAGEIVQACGKALRFGLRDGYPGGNRTNAEDIEKEVAHLLAVFEMLAHMDGAIIKDTIDRRTMVAKKRKVEEFMEYAEKVFVLKRADTRPGRGGEDR